MLTPPDVCLPKNIFAFNMNEDVECIGSLQHSLDGLEPESTVYIFKNRNASIVYISGLDSIGRVFANKYPDRNHFNDIMVQIKEAFAANPNDPYYKAELEFASKFAAFMNTFNSKKNECVCGAKSLNYTGRAGHSDYCGYMKS